MKFVKFEKLVKIDILALSALMSECIQYMKKCHESHTHWLLLVGSGKLGMLNEYPQTLLQGWLEFHRDAISNCFYVVVTVLAQLRKQVLFLFSFCIDRWFMSFSLSIGHVSNGIFHSEILLCKPTEMSYYATQIISTGLLQE